MLKASFNYYLFGELLVRVGLIVLTLLWIQSGTVEHGYIVRWIRTPLLRSHRPVQIMLSFFVLAAFFAVLMILAGSVHLLFLLYSAFLLVDIATIKLRRGDRERAAFSAFGGCVASRWRNYRADRTRPRLGRSL
ncbi:hypothetical protein [Bradyrhizobium sp. LTSPM299]|uniref:hypothetical protein n=1 Tax=Bradyrhizobium sp. LTSPM299 TaxID=1619233 RepID=UPI001AEBEF20|nr:hypothetical protein [Bradyrhizobium sp. LTSPM299]